jgi:16S rRNA (cytosine967-C5)-methyltransferase
LSAVASISSARKAAFGILLAVERGQAHSDQLLRGKGVSALPSADRNLATALVMGVLRWQILLDDRIRPFLKRPNAKLDPEVRIALRLGAFQLEFLHRIPAHAAIDESVELTKQSGHRFAAGMVNAVLRRLGAAPRFQVLEESARELALAQAHPAWMVERWASMYGLEAARQICRHGQMQPPLTVRIGAAEAEEELISEGIRLEPGAFLASARTVISGDATATAAFQRTSVRIQDEGSQLIGELAACASENPDEKVKSILDACAAPGGKTLILAERNPEAHIVACEASARRFSELRKRMTACGGRVECRQADAAELAENSEFDLALVDAPCSGTGTLGRNPEIRHRVKLEDLARHAERQCVILLAALRAVRPGGRVVYATCSLEPEENEQVIAATLNQAENARQISLVPLLHSMAQRKILTAGGAEQMRSCLRPDGTLRLLPGVCQTDGFYAAMIEKTA